MADPKQFVVPDAREKHSGIYTCVLRDENNQPISSSVLTAFLLTLYDLQTLAVINSRSAQNALNANNVTVDTSGNVQWIWLPADMTMINPNKFVEEHVALFEAKWLDINAYPRQSNHEIHFMVNRIPKNA